MDTSVFACNNGVCEVGPGNVGPPFAAGLNIMTGTVAHLNAEKFLGADYTTAIISGSLPPSLQLSLPDPEWTVTGTPTNAIIRVAAVHRHYSDAEHWDITHSSRTSGSGVERVVERLAG